MTAKVFILSKHTCDYDVNNVSAQGSISLHVIFKEYISSASYLLGKHTTFPFVSFCILFIILCSKSINPVYCSLKFWNLSSIDWQIRVS